MSALGLYRALTTAAGPLFEMVLSRRLGRGKEDPERLPERSGFAGRARPAGRLLWVHAASVGESIAVLPLIDALLETAPGAHALLTTGTVTSARLLAARLPERVLHQFVPLDQPQAWQRFFDHWRPEALVTVESELWPNMIHQGQARGIRMALVNARMSDRSHRRWRHVVGIARELIGAFDLILAQSEADARRFRELGGRRVQVSGNLKRAAPPLPADPCALRALQEALRGRPCWLGASTHAGEEAPLLTVHRSLLGFRPEALLILAPRHPERGREVLSEAVGAGFEASLRSSGALPEPGHPVYVADTLGELGLFYRLARFAFIGKSLAGEGGQNPLEAARLGCPPIYGPHMENFREIAASLETSGAALCVRDQAELADVVMGLMQDDAACRSLAQRAAQAAAREVEVLDATLAALRPLLLPPARAGADAAA